MCCLGIVTCPVTQCVGVRAGAPITYSAEFQMLRDLRHENVNSFVGACVEPGNVCIITEYCSRGSLRGVSHE